MRRLSTIFGAIVLAVTAIALPGCATPQTESVMVDTAQALKMANRGYITVNALVQTAIRNDVIKGEDLDTVQDLDMKINAGLDEATRLRGTARDLKVQEIWNLLGRLEAFVTTKKEGPGNGIHPSDGTDISGRRSVLHNQGTG